MVLKSFIHFVINKYLKNYIERLDYEKLDFSLTNGERGVFSRSNSSFDLIVQDMFSWRIFVSKPMHWFVEYRLLSIDCFIFRPI